MIITFILVTNQLYFSNRINLFQPFYFIIIQPFLKYDRSIFFECILSTDNYDHDRCDMNHWTINNYVEKYILLHLSLTGSMKSRTEELVTPGSNIADQSSQADKNECFHV